MSTSTVENKSKNQTIFNTVFWILFVLILIIFSYYLGRSHSFTTGSVPISNVNIVNTLPSEGQKNIDFGIFWEVWDMVKVRYVDHEQLDANVLVRGAIDGMLRATDDPYTLFFDREELAAFNEDLNGTFEGIGAEIGMRDDILTVIAPLEGMPAEIAGLRSGDMIVKIDDTLSAGLTINEAVNLIRGPGGSSVILTIFRDGDDDTREVTIVRDAIIVKSVTVEIVDGVGYIRISRFGDDTSRLFSMATRQVIDTPDLQGVVIDLRNNPGGYLESAVQLAGVMLPRGAKVVMSEDETGARESFYADNGNVLGDIPIVVLINGGSASASEILAGALRDNREDVYIIGQQSFGKGSVQELLSLRGGGALKITVAKWLTPNGDQISHIGIAPDEIVEISNEDFDEEHDPQKDRAIEWIRQRAEK